VSDVVSTHDSPSLETVLAQLQAHRNVLASAVQAPISTEETSLQQLQHQDQLMREAWQRVFEPLLQADFLGDTSELSPALMDELGQTITSCQQLLAALMARHEAMQATWFKELQQVQQLHHAVSGYGDELTGEDVR
jgi:hypothetical protein